LFGGSFDDLHAVREESDVPVLCKDFVLEPYQVTEARVHGADAVLLMLSVLDDDSARACLLAARRLAMDALVEVHDEAELRRAIALPASIIGINHRDLRTLSIDLGVSDRLAPLVPEDRIVVAESGIETRRDVERIAGVADALLVGASIMRAREPRDAALGLVFGRVKVCGLTSIADARAAAAAGAAMGGLVFADESPRRVSEATSSTIAEDGALPLVGVFVNTDARLVGRIAHALRLVAVQLHGEEDEAYLRSLRPRLPDGCAVWSVSHVGPGGGSVGDTSALGACDRIVFDTASGAARGGTGRAFDWSAVARHPRLQESLLSGGIGCDNAVLARAMGSWAIDVNSRLESSPGKKDPTVLRELFRRLRGPGRARSKAAAAPTLEEKGG
jgi:indole-3-glycerol phosphate synthase/phosphoribosylanthranilate isomerase